MPINETIAALEETIHRPLTNVERLIAENAWADAVIEVTREETRRIKELRDKLANVPVRVGAS